MPGLTTASVLIGVAAVAASIMLSLSNERRAAEENARLQLENLSLLMAEHVRMHVENVDLALSDVVAHLAPAARSDRPAGDAHDWRDVLQSRLRRLPQSNDLRVIDARGECLYGARDDICPSLAGHENFARHRDDPAAGLVISVPARSPAGQWEVVLSRRLDAEQGGFAGIVAAWVNLEYFERFYRSLDLGPHSAVLLRDEQMRLLARHPPAGDKTGVPVPDHHALPHLRQGLKYHTYPAISVVDGIERLYSYRQAGDLPLFALAAVAKSDYLAEWIRNCWYFGVGGGILSVLLIILGVLQRRAEGQVRSSREGLQLLLDSMGEGAYGVDTRGRCTFVNRSFLQLLEFDAPGEVLGKPVHELIHHARPDGSPYPADECGFLQVCGSGRPFTAPDEVFWRRDGTALPVECRSNPIVKDGGVIGAIVTFADVTERRRMIDELQQNEAKFRTLFESAGDAIFLMEDYRFVDCNRRALIAFGCEREQIIDQPPYHFSPEVQPDGRSSVDSAQEKIDAALAGQPQHFEWRHIRCDGTPFDTEVSLARFVSGGKYYLQGIVRDVTARKRAEQQLRIAATAFDAQQAILIADANSRILQVNRAFTEVTGYSAAEAVGRHTRLLQSGRHEKSFYDAMWQQIREGGVWQGEIWNRRKNGEVYPEWLTIAAVKDERGEVTHYVATHTDITVHKAAEEEIKHLAFYDPLTRLPNRRLLIERLQRVLAGGARSRLNGALMFIDLDNFKTLNDTLGHDKGDLLLQQVAQRLPLCVRESDTVGRLGGDEFLIILDGLSENVKEAASDVRYIGERLLATLNCPFSIAGREYHSTPSIGVTLFHDRHATPDELLKQADLAMYRAKSSRNSLCFFDPKMQAEVEARARLESDLREAVRERQFVLHYQGQVNREGRLIGAEALLRWRRPDGGLVSPAQFISLAEETGLILPLGQQVLETACLQLVAWAGSRTTAHLSLAVNISSLQFKQPDFLEKVWNVIERTGIDPRLLKLELTESMLLENMNDSIAKMNALKARGVGLALDDFGTGYSCLAYLKRLPFDQLKIDRSFVEDMLVDHHDAVIARAIVELGTSLGLAVIAEGVETEEQRAALIALGCHGFQGYLFDRPCAIEQFDPLRDFR